MANAWGWIAGALLGLGCASPAPPQPAEPTGAERVARQEGYLDGRKMAARKFQAELDAKQEEVTRLQADIAELKRAEAGFGQTASALLTCQEALQASSEQVAALEQALEDRYRSGEVTRAKALGPAGRKRELSECYAQSMLCDNLLSVFLDAASGDAERQTLANLNARLQRGEQIQSSPARKTQASDGSSPRPTTPQRSGSNRVQCCDGTLSPTCMCDRASFRGCCSHHGGICGRCD